jgi:hypothetical protein
VVEIHCMAQVARGLRNPKLTLLACHPGVKDGQECTSRSKWFNTTNL